MYHSHVPHEVRSPYRTPEPRAYQTSYLDRINVSNARLAGLQKDLHMNDTIWNTGSMYNLHPLQKFSKLAAPMELYL
jgi:hypothetical protein